MSKKAAEAKVEDRRRKVAGNLLSGLNYRDIAEGLQCSIGTVAGDVKVIIRRWQKEQVDSAEKWIALQCRRLDASINFMWDDIKKGDTTAIGRMQAIIEQQGKLMGYERLLAQLHLNVNLQDLPDDVLARIANGDDVDLTTIARTGRTRAKGA